MACRINHEAKYIHEALGISDEDADAIVRYVDKLLDKEKKLSEVIEELAKRYDDCRLYYAIMVLTKIITIGSLLGDDEP